MDQIRTALAWLKRHHFWVLCVLIPLIALFGWWSASRTMSTKFASQQSTIKSQFQSLDTLRNAAFHPNQVINEKQQAEMQKQIESVTKIWQQLYDRQREVVLKWPEQLGKDFRDAIEKLQFNDDITREHRNRYQNYIESHFPELPKRINARPLDLTATAGGPGGEFGGGRFVPGPEGFAPGMPGAIPDDNDYVCEWLDQITVREKLNFPERPSSLRIWVTQEDLWVYHTLLDVVAKTNQAANATRMSNAAVKVVYILDVGQAAAQYSHQPGRLLIPPAMPQVTPGMEGGPGGPGMPGPEGGPPGGMMGERMGMAGPGGRMGEMPTGPGGMGGVMSPAQEQGFLLSGRYLDDKGVPIQVGGGGMMPEGGSPDAPAAAPDPNAPAPPLDLAQFGIGYKRLPVRMVLNMDLRWLPQFITNCANEPLRVEVQEVRINPLEFAGMDPTSAASGGSMPGGGFSRGFEGARGPGMGGSPGASIFPERTGIQNFPAQPNVANVVVQGTIYIFNKPNMSLLQQAPAAGTEQTAATQ